MKSRILFVPVLFLAATLLLTGCNLVTGRRSRITVNFDYNWKFHKGDLPAAEDFQFDDSGWRELDLPHDWSIEDIDSIPLPDTVIPGGPFLADAPGGRATGFTLGGTAWYRKHFRLGREYEGKRIYVLFEGVYMNSDVWVNGEYLGNHPYGYTSFWYDITDALRPAGENNVIAVQVKNEGKNTRWYSGSGIYRHVRLIAAESFHFPPWGISVNTASLREEEAIITVRNRIKNASEHLGEVWVNVSIRDKQGTEIAVTNRSCKLEPGTEGITEFEFLVPDPVLWTPDNPFLYELESEVLLGNKMVDRIITTFGIRTIDFDSNSGFLLNGQKTLLYGACMHHDNGPLGARAYDRAEERKVEILKANGFNAVRCVHNPPSPAFLDACDRIGMLVIDELFDQWQIGKNEDDYHRYFYDWWLKDMENTVLRDRNHPSVIMWSTGNDIPDKDLEETMDWSRTIADSIRSLDPTRAVTAGVNKWKYENWDTTARFAEPLDVVGYDYLPEMYEPDHIKHPERVIYGSGSFPGRSFQYWMPVIDLDWVIGDFVWTGLDYLGEASLGWQGTESAYPWTVAYCGDIDICGFKRPQSFYRDVLWKRGDKVAVFVHNPEPTFGKNGNSPWGWDDVYPSWTWEGYEGRELKVDVYSACEKVRLLLNDTDLGIKSMNTESRASWNVPFEAGELKAIGYEGEDTAAIASLNTVSEPVSIRLTADRMTISPDNQDLSFITVELVDTSGNRHPWADNEIFFELSGPGEIIAAGNSNPMSTESFQQKKRSAFQGRCLVIVKSTGGSGRIRLTASGKDLEPATIIINTRG